MHHTPLSDFQAEALPERRKRGRRAADMNGSKLDLDGAYNDGARPSPLRLGTAIRLYGSLAWIVATSAIGSLYLLKSLWVGVSSLWGSG